MNRLLKKILGIEDTNLSFSNKQRMDNQRHCYDYPSENLGWKKMGGHPVFGNSDTGTVFDPYVFMYLGCYYMVASMRKDGSLHLLKSNDGELWKSISLILGRRRYTWESVVNRGCMLLVDGKWHLWYTGQFLNKSAIGHLVGTSMTSFKRNLINRPVLSPTLKGEGVSVMNPCVIWDNHRKLFQMWYSAGENYEPDAIFYAESVDGDTWMKNKEPVLTKLPSHVWEQYKVGGCNVVKKDDGTYIMYYIGYQNLDVTRICFAVSKDGIEWYREDNNICLSPTKGSWDNHAVYKPSVIEYKGEYYMWYNGRNGINEYIGLAKKRNE